MNTNKSVKTTLKRREFKVVVVGDAGVGKTCLTLALKHNFDDFTFSTVKSTIGVDTIEKTVNIDSKYCEYAKRRGVMNQNDNDKNIDFNISTADKSVKLKVWDTAGTEKYSDNFAPLFIRNADAVIFVFSFDDITSLENIPKKLKKLKQLNEWPQSPEPLLLLVGTKIDLLFEKNEEIKVENVLSNFFKKISIKEGGGGVTTVNSKEVYEQLKALFFEMGGNNAIKSIPFTSSIKKLNIMKVFKIIAASLYLRSLSMIKERNNNKFSSFVGNTGNDTKKDNSYNDMDFLVSSIKKCKKNSIAEYNEFETINLSDDKSNNINALNINNDGLCCS